MRVRRVDGGRCRIVTFSMSRAIIGSMTRERGEKKGWSIDQDANYISPPCLSAVRLLYPWPPIPLRGMKERERGDRKPWMDK